MAEKSMMVLVVEPGRRPVLTAIDGSLESMQAIVGGHLEMVVPFEDEVALICNEEAKIEGLAFNRALYDYKGRLADVLAGPFFVCGTPVGSENFASLPDEMVHKYAALFEAPEAFYRGFQGLQVVKYEPEAKAYLGVGYELHPFKTGVDIQFTDGDGQTIEWYTVENDSEEYANVEAIAKEKAGKIAFRIVSEKCLTFDEARSVDERLQAAEERSEDARSCGMIVDILQLKQGDEYHGLRFEPLRRIPGGVDGVSAENYAHVYRYSEDRFGSLEDGDGVMGMLEDVFAKFNFRHPADFRGHSLSTSDVVVLNGAKAYYCDSFGFAELPERFCEDFMNSLHAKNERGMS